MKQIMVITFFCVILLTSGQSFGATAVQTASNSTNKEKQYTLNPIVVTANKIKTDKQDLPLSVTVFDSKMMEDLNLDSLESLVNLSPNVSSFGVDGVTTSLVFRGVGGLRRLNKLWNTNVDGVIMPYVGVDTMLDVERVEILRGSQGSLYGRNTHGGAVNVITKDPGEEFNLSSSLNLESYNTIKASLALGGPINDSLGYRLAVAYKHTDGYFKNDFLDKDDTDYLEKFSGRGKIVLSPDSKNKLTFSLYADSYNGGNDNYQLFTNNDVSDLKLETDSNIAGNKDGYLFSPSITWEKEFSDFKMISITNYSASNYKYEQESDFSRFDIGGNTFDENFSTASQELRFSGGDNTNLQWLVGFFGLIEYLNAAVTDYAGKDVDPAWGLVAGDGIAYSSDINTYIASTFGQIIYSPFPQFEITGAARLDYEQKTVKWSNAPNLFGYAAGNINQTDNWFAISPSLSLAWLFTEQQRAYVSVSRGFKAGDFSYLSPNLAFVQESVDPEYITTYEIGYKGTHLDNRLETNVAFFYIDWDNMQVDIADPVFVGSFQKLNAGKAHSMGMEIETRALLMPGLEAFANLGYMFEYKFDDFKQSPTVDLSGKKLPYINQYNFSAGSIYRNDFGIFVGFDVGLYGNKYLVENNDIKQDPYWLANAKIGYESENWELYLYARNLFDERYANNVFSAGGLTGAVVGEPLTIGLQLGVRF